MHEQRQQKLIFSLIQESVGYRSHDEIHKEILVAKQELVVSLASYRR